MGSLLKTVQRGEIWWADLDPVQGQEQGGKRPVLVLSNNIFNTRSGTVIVVPVTSQEPRAGYPLTLELTETELPKRSWVKMGQIRTLAVSRLDTKAAEVSFEQLLSVIEGLYEIIGE